MKRGLAQVGRASPSVSSDGERSGGTAHLDSTSELAVQAALGEALAGRTAVVIAHRLSTVRAVDLILVVEDGRIVERGTHLELLALGGRYEELYRTQFDRDGVPAPVAGNP